MRNLLLLCLLLNAWEVSFSQHVINGVIADSSSHQVLAFATVNEVRTNNAVIAKMNGQFSIHTASADASLQFSYIGYRTVIINASSIHSADTVFLAPSGKVLGEVILRPDRDKIKRILNTAIRAKPANNPSQLDAYQCFVYYKMKVDLVNNQRSSADSARLVLRNRRNQELVQPVKDTNKTVFGETSHLLFSETYSKRLYKRPEQIQEHILASRFSGLRKTYFTNLVTNVLPFHVYSDYISLNGRDYTSPLAKGWPQRYQFRLENEFVIEGDTTFILSYSPKEKTNFNGLEGLVYINSNGYAISHFIGSTVDSASHREIRIEQIYMRTGDRWFPRELNYDLIFKKYPAPGMGMRMNGHSVIDSVSFHPLNARSFDKAYPVKLSDSVDLRTEQEWRQLRPDTLSFKEAQTYRIIDSISRVHKIENLVKGMGRLSMGRWPIGKVDLDISRIITNNNYEKIRLGAGLYTNDELSKYFTVGGWLGYGFQDKKFKYGASAIIYPSGNKDRWLKFQLRNEYQNAGIVNIHPDIDRSGFRNWLLVNVDQVKEYALIGHTRQGYWEFEATALSQQLESRTGNNFIHTGIPVNNFETRESGLSIRYGYGEKRVPAYGNYFSAGTKYPVFYLRSSIGKITALNYRNDYLRLIAGITYSGHIHRWGKDMVRLEGGFIHSLNSQPFSRSYLLAAKGFRTDGINYFAWGGFQTMRPFDYYSDTYASMLYKHEFDHYLWKLKFSKPFISLSHNMIYGKLNHESKLANDGIVAPLSGYHESGLVLNQLLQRNFLNAAYIYLNAGTFYHWSPVKERKNLVFVIGLSAGF